MAGVTPGGQIMAVEVPPLQDSLADHVPAVNNAVRQIPGGDDAATCTTSQASVAVFVAGDFSTYLHPCALTSLPSKHQSDAENGSKIDQK